MFIFEDLTTPDVEVETRDPPSITKEWKTTSVTPPSLQNRQPQHSVITRARIHLQSRLSLQRTHGQRQRGQLLLWQKHPAWSETIDDRTPFLDSQRVSAVTSRLNRPEQPYASDPDPVRHRPSPLHEFSVHHFQLLCQRALPRSADNSR